MDKVVHFHIPVNEMSRAKKFYTDIFGWEIKEIEKRQLPPPEGGGLHLRMRRKR